MTNIPKNPPHPNRKSPFKRGTVMFANKYYLVHKDPDTLHDVYEMVDSALFAMIKVGKRIWWNHEDDLWRARGDAIDPDTGQELNSVLLVENFGVQAKKH